MLWQLRDGNKVWKSRSAHSGLLPSLSRTLLLFLLLLHHILRPTRVFNSSHPKITFLSSFSISNMALAPYDAEPSDPTTCCFSNPIPLPYLSIQECVSKFKPRINKHAERADEGSWAFQEDFQATGGSIHRVGSIDLLSGNFAALTVPDALPDRIFIIGYLSEAAFVFDGK